MKSLLMSVNELNDEAFERMYRIMVQYYENIEYEKFMKDMRDKDYVLILIDENELVGFTTVQLMAFTVDGKDVLGVFSGNTIVDRDYSFQLELQRGFARFIKALMAEEKDREIYWFLICKGFKTYRYLSMYFNEYYPNHRKDTPPFEKRIMDTYASAKYGDLYDRESGIVINDGYNDYLKEGVAPIDEKARKNKEVIFFEKSNPGHRRGDELVCLAKFDEGNLKSGFQRMLDDG